MSLSGCGRPVYSNTVNNLDFGGKWFFLMEGEIVSRPFIKRPDVPRCRMCDSPNHTEAQCGHRPGGICAVCGQSCESFSTHLCPKRVVSGKDAIFEEIDSGKLHTPAQFERLKEGFKMMGD